MLRLLFAIGALAIANPSFAATKHHMTHRSHKIESKQIGTASWYGPGFSRHKTASGERFNPYGLTAASKSIPLGTKVIVTNLKNGKQTVLKVNDRGPYVGHRIMDVSKGAAIKLGMLSQGTARIKITVLGKHLPLEVAQSK